jgi:ATPase subunit of ABC transporter with duplicated ATPase domains
MIKEIVCNNLSYSIDNKKILNSLSVRLNQNKIGLVGSNGVGKTTLIRVLVGQLQPNEGSIFINGTIGYLPQDLSAYGHGSVASVLGIEQKLQALEAITAGHGTLHDFDTVGDDWDIQERAMKVMDQVNLGHLAITRNFATLSGGEKTRILFARLLINKPDFLVLDEPTNNMDADSRTALYSAINTFDGGVLVVSHDRQLLHYVDQIAELSSLGLKLYGGNYASYQKQKQIEQEALETDIIDAQKQVEKTKRIIQQSKEKYDKRVSMGNKKRHKGGQPKSFLDFQKGRAEVTKSKLESRTDKQLDLAHEKLSAAKAKLEQKDFLAFNLDATRVPNGKIVIDLQHVAFAYPGCDAVIKDFNLAVVGPKRVAIVGSNGSGKSTLLKLIMHQLEPTNGTITVGVEHMAYLDQNLSILFHDQTIAENFKRLNSNIAESDCRTRLATFLFSQETVDKPVNCLSGGEKMRAAMACIFMGDNPPQLVMLDEPTNNMDLESINALESALGKYQGALLVVSHDKIFLENIGIEAYVSLPPKHTLEDK